MRPADTPSPVGTLVESAAVLTDGAHECRGAAIADAVQHLRARLAAHGIEPGTYVEFRCEHTLASALLWTALLDAGVSACISATDPRVPLAPTPAFCRVSVRASWDDGPTLHVEEHAAWNGVRADGEARLVFRTSGTTGASKFAAHSASRLWGNARNCVERLGLRASDRIVIPVPIYHMFGLGAAFLPGVLAGASMESQRASNVLRYAERERVFEPNIAFLTPSFLETLLRGRRGARAYDLTVVAGDVLAPEVSAAYEARYGPVVSLYGSTELGAVAASSRDDARDVRAQTVGAPMPGVECRIDEQLWVRHPHGFDGYLDEHGHALPPTSDGWFATRDRAEWYDHTRLRILGRVDHALKRDGVLVTLAEIEASMRSVPGLAASVVVVSGTSARGRGLVACCVVAPGAALDAAAVRRACLERMPRSHVPDRVVLIDAVPVLPSGKPDRVALTTLVESGA